jgi:hypothetical protein
MAYTDVVTWLYSKDDDSMASVIAEVLYGTARAKELIGKYGTKRVIASIDDQLKLKHFDLPQLRRLIDIYRRDTRKLLECPIWARTAPNSPTT